MNGLAGDDRLLVGMSASGAGSRLQVSEASLYPLAMAFDVCSQLLLSLLDTTGFQRVDDRLMTIDAAGPFGLLDTLAETTTI